MDKNAIEAKLDHATESAFGRFAYRVLFPTLFAIIGFLGIRAITSLDASVGALQKDSAEQTKLQIATQGELSTIKTQLQAQNAFQQRIDDQQDKRIDRVESKVGL